MIRAGVRGYRRKEGEGASQGTQIEDSWAWTTGGGGEEGLTVGAIRKKEGQL